jgi:hypothetical protein
LKCALSALASAAITLLSAVLNFVFLGERDNAIPFGRICNSRESRQLRLPLRFSVRMKLACLQTHAAPFERN